MELFDVPVKEFVKAVTPCDNTLTLTLLVSYHKEHMIRKNCFKLFSGHLKNYSTIWKT